MYQYLEEKCPAVKTFSKKLGIVRDNFNNKDYNGPHCEKVLKNLKQLEEIVEEKYKPFVDCLSALKEVKNACFGPVLDPNYQTAIDNFENTWNTIYIDFGIWFTNKAHVIISHIPQAIERTGRSLYLSSEQVVEATHAQFDKFWRNFKVRDLESESHGKRLLKCVVFFNSKNL